MSTQGRIDDVRPAVATFTDIPLIDLAPLQDGTAKSRQMVAEEIRGACERVGFFYVASHGVPERLVEDVFEASDAFFALPHEEKMKLRLGKHTSFRGFLPDGVNGGTAAGNRKQAFQILSEKLPADPRGREVELCEPNRWPESPPGFRITLLDYYSRMEALADRLLRLFAIGLAVPEDSFVKHFREPIGMLRLLRYLPQDPNDDVIGSRPHKDGTAVTILAQDDAEALEALNDRGEWMKVAPIPGTLVVNPGETMKLWSDGLYASTPHRVINASGRVRTSIPFFAYPDFHTVIEPVVKSVRRARDVELYGHLDPGRTTTSGEIVLESWTMLYG
jgi:isopenicillin N synthase-like dioxygenase